jgi:DNA-binding transcriptional regulator YhcF (GntR family)
VLDLPFRADPLHPDPVYRQLADHLAERITAGRLPAGERVPPTRELASASALSRNTVTRAYAWLSEAGFLGAHVGRGTFVQRAARAERVQRAPEAIRSGVTELANLLRRQGARPRRTATPRVARRTR